MKIHYWILIGWVTKTLLTLIIIYFFVNYWKKRKERVKK
jgi:hypothetical protein